MKRAAPNVPFVQAYNTGSAQRPTAIVLSLSNTTSDKGSALAIANYHHKSTAPLLSYHYIVDEAETYRCVPDKIASYGNPYNAINILICAQPHEITSMHDGENLSPVMERAADLVLALLWTYKIRFRYITGPDEARWMQHKWLRRGGVIVRARGTWPYELFFDAVAASRRKV